MPQHPDTARMLREAGAALAVEIREEPRDADCPDHYNRLYVTARVLATYAAESVVDYRVLLRSWEGDESVNAAEHMARLVSAAAILGAASAAFLDAVADCMEHERPEEGPAE